MCKANNRNLVQRGEFIYWRQKVAGKRYLRSTGFRAHTKDGWKNARIWRDKQVALLAAGRIDEVEADRLKTDLVTMDQVVRILDEAARIRRVKFGSPSVTTFRNYVGALRRILTACYSQSWESLTLDALTADIAAEYRELTIDSCADPQLQARQAISAGSQLRQARALFSKDLMAYLKARTRIPATLQGWIDEASHHPKKRKYTMPATELLQHTEAAAADLRNTDPELYKVYLMARYLGMRAGEMAAARVEWIVERPSNLEYRFMEIRERTSPELFKPKGIDHYVPIHIGVQKQLLDHEKLRGPYLLPGRTYEERRLFVSGAFAAWMRSIGWDRATYSKGAHELRKLAGSDWYTVYGVSTAALWLGHADIRTTYDYYSDLAVHPAPLAPAV